MHIRLIVFFPTYIKTGLKPNGSMTELRLKMLSIKHTGQKSRTYFELHQVQVTGHTQITTEKP